MERHYDNNRFKGKEESGTRLFMWGLVVIFLFITLYSYTSYLLVRDTLERAEMSAITAQYEYGSRFTTRRIVVLGSSNYTTISGNYFAPDSAGECGIFLSDTSNIYIANNVFK